MNYEHSQTKTGKNEKNLRGFSRVAAWAGTIAKRLVNRQERTPEDVGTQFTKLVDGIVSDTGAGRRDRAGQHPRFGTIIRSGVAESPTGGMYGVLVERSADGLGVDKISVEGLSRGTPQVRVVYQGPNTVEATVARRTFDPHRPGVPIRAPGDGTVDATGFAQLNEVIHLTRWDPAESAGAPRPTGAYHFQQ